MSRPPSWYREWFDRHEYELVYHARDEHEAEEAVDLIIGEIGPAPDAHFLDVGCGRGRHAIALARRGFSVTGVDLSRGSVEDARRRAAAAGVDPRFEVWDMRDVFCHACADVVINLFTAFGYFSREADHMQAIRAMATALKPDGWIVQDFMNADRIRRTFVPVDEATRDGINIRQERWIENGRINKRIFISSEAGDREFSESVRLFTLDDFRAMYRECGLEIVRTIGSYAGEDFEPDSPRLILVGRRPR